MPAGDPDEPDAGGRPEGIPIPSRHTPAGRRFRLSIAAAVAAGLLVLVFGIVWNIDISDPSNPDNIKRYTPPPAAVLPEPAPATPGAGELPGQQYGISPSEAARFEARRLAQEQGVRIGFDELVARCRGPRAERICAVRSEDGRCRGVVRVAVTGGSSSFRCRRR